VHHPQLQGLLRQGRLIFGTCKDFDITVLPTDESDTPAAAAADKAANSDDEPAEEGKPAS
jgi:hypothetical protein